jgi:hypothetical protein
MSLDVCGRLWCGLSSSLADWRACWFRKSVSWFTRARGEGLEGAIGVSGAAVEAGGKSKPPAGKGKLAGGGGEGEFGSVLGMLRGHGVSGGVEGVDVEVKVEEDRRSKKAGCDIAVLQRRTPHRWIDGPCLSLTSELPNQMRHEVVIE